MTSIQERLQLKRVPLDTWNIREQLCLASAVVRSGDQNWMSVSRALKTVGDPNRPNDWYSQKSCAAQYGALLEHVETPKRKKRSSEGAVETPQESILKRLTQERIAEIQKTINDLNQQYQTLKDEVTELRDPATSDDRVREIWSGIEAAKRAREREQAKRAVWLREREERRARTERPWRTPSSETPPTAANTTSPAPAPSSPLLTSLLKSSPVVTTPQLMTHPANVVETISPSAGAPTLSMLLDKQSTAPSPVIHENKLAAIEHIKSQLVQIEQQLIASTSPSPKLPLPTSGPVTDKIPDLDDIEIKAEDVYAFSDIDIEIPPVSSMHKTPIVRTPEKAATVKEEEISETVPEVPAMNTQEETKSLENDTITIAPENVVPIVPAPTEPIETLQESQKETPLEPENPTDTEEVNAESPKRSFPEVKFPTPEIKVIQAEEAAPKEEEKPVETPAEVCVQDAEQEPEIVEEQSIKTEPEGAVQVETPSQPCDEPSVPQPQPHEENAPQTHEQENETAPDVRHSPLPEAVSGAAQDADVPPEQTESVQGDQSSDDKPSDEKRETEGPPQTAEHGDAVAEEAVQEASPPEEVEVTKDVENEPQPIKEISDEPQDVKSEVKSEVKEEVSSEVKEDKPSEPEDTHTETDDDTPMELIREEEKDGKKRRDYSRKRKSDYRAWSGSESAPDSPAGTDAEKNHRLWKKSVLLVYNRLSTHKYASVFLRPISDEQAPGYSQAVKRPMDLSSIKKNIDAGIIRTTAEFQRDVLLVLSNALMYNSSNHRVYMMAKEMHEEADSQFGMLLQAQAHSGLAVGSQSRAHKRRSNVASTTPTNKRRLD